jgi:hypothetical protein
MPVVIRKPMVVIITACFMARWRGEGGALVFCIESVMHGRKVEHKWFFNRPSIHIVSHDAMRRLSRVHACDPHLG